MPNHGIAKAVNVFHYMKHLFWLIYKLYISIFLLIHRFGLYIKPKKHDLEKLKIFYFSIFQKIKKLK